MNIKAATITLLLAVSCTNKAHLAENEEINESSSTSTVLDTNSIPINEKDSEPQSKANNIDSLVSLSEIEDTKFAPKKLYGKWHLIKVNEKSLGELSFVSGKTPKPIIEFIAKDNTVYGTVECNSFDGNFHIINDNIKISKIIATQIGCGDFEKFFFKAISDCKIKFTEEGNLMLQSKGDVLEFSKK